MIENIKEKNNLIPVLPLRDIVIYPNMLVPLFIGREKSIKSLEISIELDKKIILLTQKDSLKEFPNIEDLFSVGTLSSILQIIKLPDGTVKVLVEGLKAVTILDIIDNEKYLEAKIDFIDNNIKNDKEYNVMIKTLINEFENYIKLDKKIPLEIIESINNNNDKSKIIYTIASNIPMKINDKQYILEEQNLSNKLEFLIKILMYEIELLQIEKKIKNRIKKQMEKGQKEYYLNEQIKAIQKELEEINNVTDEYEIIKKKIKLLKIDKDIKFKINNELNKLKIMSPISAEATVIRNYIDWLILIPWSKKSKIKKDLILAKKILDNDHYGLYDIKERILEYLAVQNRNNKIKGPILCFIGPPGVGKTSLGISIAKATGRKYEKISLGGLKDEAEIRGHRKTYIGSMPGKIIQKIVKTGVKNPLILLDEIDKMSFDIRGDPASALLEVLDSEQNNRFNDHYLEIDYDLSEVMFIATSNSTNIPYTLLDRMEIIRISGYSENEKLNIVNKYLIKKQMISNALKKNEIKISKSAILQIIKYYTKESGLRNLEREISKICRKTVKSIFINKKINSIKISVKNLSKFLGIKKFENYPININLKIGQCVGLAWTELGGEILIIETLCVPGNGKLIYTGSLGKIIKESIKIALTIVRSKFTKLENFYKNNDIHIHVPEGSTPKDGPSAGIAILISMISYLTNNLIDSNIAMTGEITLQGQILPIGGLKEKIMAAKRYNIKKILIPNQNFKNLSEINNDILLGINILPISNIDEAINYSFSKINIL